MVYRILFVLSISSLAVASSARGQAPADAAPMIVPNNNGAPAAAPEDDSRWQSQNGAAPSTENLRQTITKVSKGNGVLPNEHGQVWREYDISPYTSRVPAAPRPEQAVIDWVLRETGTELWFSEPLGILSANRNTLRVYHTPEVHDVILSLVERFVNSEAESHVFGVRLVTVGSPNWRSKAQGMMQPVTVKSPGLEAWIMTKENTAMLLAELRKRSDYSEHSAPNLLIHNGQTHTISSIKPREFARGVLPSPDTIPGYHIDFGKIQEGYTLELSPLLELNSPGSSRMVEAVIKCQVDQVEKMTDVNLEAPGIAGKISKVQVQVPQMSSWKLHERFRWPAEYVLVLSRGVVATPKSTRSTVMGISNPFSGATAGRADALLFVFSNGKISQTILTQGADPRVSSANNRGRY